MRSKYNTRQRKKSIQGLRSFKVSLPKNIREKILKKADIYSKIMKVIKSKRSDKLDIKNIYSSTKSTNKMTS